MSKEQEQKIRKLKIRNDIYKKQILAQNELYKKLENDLLIFKEVQVEREIDYRNRVEQIKELELKATFLRNDVKELRVVEADKIEQIKKLTTFKNEVIAMQKDNYGNGSTTHILLYKICNNYTE